MNQQEMADLLEIQQLAARYMTFSGTEGTGSLARGVHAPTASTTRSARRTRSTTSRRS